MTARWIRSMKGTTSCITFLRLTIRLWPQSMSMWRPGRYWRWRWSMPGRVIWRLWPPLRNILITWSPWKLFSVCLPTIQWIRTVSTSMNCSLCCAPPYYRYQSSWPAPATSLASKSCESSAKSSKTPKSSTTDSVWPSIWPSALSSWVMVTILLTQTICRLPRYWSQCSLNSPVLQEKTGGTCRRWGIFMSLPWRRRYSMRSMWIPTRWWMSMRRWTLSLREGWWLRMFRLQCCCKKIRNCFRSESGIRTTLMLISRSKTRELSPKQFTSSINTLRTLIQIC